MALILGNGGLNVRLYDRDPEKAHPCAEPRVLAYFASKSIKAVASCKNPKNGKKTSIVNTFGAQSHTCAETKPLGDRDELLHRCRGPRRSLITSANFYDCRLWGLSVVGVKFWVFPLTRVVALTTLSHCRASV